MPLKKKIKNLFSKKSSKAQAMNAKSIFFYYFLGFTNFNAYYRNPPGPMC